MYVVGCMTTDNQRHNAVSLEGTWVDGCTELSVGGSADELVVREAANNGCLGSPATVDEAAGMVWWSHGFIDTQVNGYGGVDYSGPELTVDGVRAVVGALLETGTTAHVPTVITSSQERICTNLELIARAREADTDLARAIPALHVEGPYISELDGPRGAHDAQYVRDPDLGELREWIASARGHLKVITLAPERRGAIEAIRFLTDQGIVVSIGHTAADGETIAAAIAAGAAHSTHLGNGSHATIPRLRNYLWAQLASDELSAGIIADGFHLPAEVMRTFVRAKRPHRIVTVSDVAPVGGLAPGRYDWGTIALDVHDDGHVALAGTPYLAGSGHLLDRGIVQLLIASDLSLAETVATCTTNAARLLGRDATLLDHPPALGSTPSALVRFTVGEATIAVSDVIVDGHLVYHREAAQ